MCECTGISKGLEKLPVRVKKVVEGRRGSVEVSVGWELFVDFVGARVGLERVTWGREGCGRSGRECWGRRKGLTGRVFCICNKIGAGRHALHDVRADLPTCTLVVQVLCFVGPMPRYGQPP